MNKATTKQYNQALQLATVHPAYAASTLAVLHRSANKRDRFSIEHAIAAYKLGQYLTTVNGCLVPVQS